MATALNDLIAAQVFDEVVNDRFLQILQDDPSINWIPRGPGFGHDESFMFKYPDEIRREATGALAANIALLAASITVVSDTVFQVGDQIWINGQEDLVNYEQVIYRVTAKPGANVLTVTRLTTADAAVVSTGQLIHITRGIGDNRKPTSTEAFGGFTERGIRDNIFQIFEANAEIGEAEQKIANEGKLYGVENGTNLLLAALDQDMYRNAYSIYQAVVNGYRRVPSTVGETPMMDGIMRYINVPANTRRRNGGGVALTEDAINDGLELMFQGGLPAGSRTVMIMSTQNARIVSALKFQKIIYNDPGANGTYGQNVQQYLGELGGTGVTIIVDRNMPNSRVPIIAQDYVQLIPRIGVNMSVVDATVPGQLGSRIIARSWWSVLVKAQNNFHSVVYHLV